MDDHTQRTNYLLAQASVHGGPKFQIFDLRDQRFSITSTSLTHQQTSPITHESTSEVHSMLRPFYMSLACRLLLLVSLRSIRGVFFSGFFTRHSAYHTHLTGRGKGPNVP